MAYVVGLMSGTSLDGCDAALVEISDSIRLVSYLTIPMPNELRARILECSSPDRSSVALICSLNFELAHYFASAALAVCKQANFDITKLECIGSHGQTVWHIPEKQDEFTASTLQLGCPSVIAIETGAAVVSDFRSADMAVGGRGAPLVPYTEYLIYRAHHDRLLQNIGGIGNVTVLPADCGEDELFAFDTGPGNMISDSFCRRYFGLHYDDGGAIASSGNIIPELLEQWMKIPYITAAPPKATGRELFGEAFTDAAISAYPKADGRDMVATACAFTAHSIAENYKRFILSKYNTPEVILSGGGSHNLTLIDMLMRLLPECKVITQEDIGFSSDAKEAVAFAVLAHESLHHRHGNSPKSTGAARRVVLGSVTYPT